MSFLMNNYARLPVAFVRGQGCYLYDQDDKAYLDAIAGIAVCGLGHAHPELVEAVSRQAHTLWHTSNLFTIPAQEEAAGQLCRLSGMEKVYFCNSGTEANEAAIKLSRLHARARGITNPLVLSFNGSFHGRTFAAMSATGNQKIQAGFAPLLPGFQHLPYNDIHALRAYANHPDVVAVILETIQGEGGIHPVQPAFIAEVRALSHQSDWLMMIDEVQTGMARTGSFFSYQQYGVVPDIVTLAKGLGNGMPVGATLARGQAAEYFKPGMHGSTFAGSALVCSVVNKVLSIYQRDNLAEQARIQGQYFKRQLEKTLANHPKVKSIRGTGLMLGIELNTPAAHLLPQALTNGIIINITAGTVIRLLPPLIISRRQIDDIVELLQYLLQ